VNNHQPTDTHIKHGDTTTSIILDRLSLCFNDPNAENVKATYGKPRCSGYEIAALKNPFARVQLIPANFADAIELGIPTQFIADSVRIGGLKRALEPLGSDQRRAVRKAYKEAASVLPNLEDEWSRWREILVGYGLGKHLGALPAMASAGGVAVNCKLDSPGAVDCNLAA
jgi:hypothetical protein